MNNPDSNKAVTDIAAVAQHLKDDGKNFAVATVVRTVSVTAAKPGAKAIIDTNGEIVDGWIGGGCAKSAVIKAAVESINDGEPRLISLQPKELLEEQGLTAGVQQDGVLAASNMCPSKGSMDIFIEPVLADPELLILGASPVAFMLAKLAQSFAFSVTCACKDPALWEDTDLTANFYSDVLNNHKNRYIVVATQGSGDMEALQKALSLQSVYLSFVGSPRKTQHLKDKLLETALPKEQIATIKGPAGLDIGAVTPQEIALSILTEVIAHRRRSAAIDKQSV